MPNYAEIAAQSVAGQSAATLAKSFAGEQIARESADAAHNEYLTDLGNATSGYVAGDVLTVIRNEQATLGHDAKLVAVLSVSPKANSKQATTKASVMVLAAIAAGCETEDLTRAEWETHRNMLIHCLGGSAHKAVTTKARYIALVESEGFRAATKVLRDSRIKTNATKGESVEPDADEQVAPVASVRSNEELRAVMAQLAERIARQGGGDAWSVMSAQILETPLGEATSAALDATARVAV